MDIKFNWYGTKQLYAKLSRFIDDIKDFRPVWKELSEDFYRTEKTLFNSQGRTGSQGKWTPLSKEYAAWKSKNYPGRPILVLKGDLKGSLVSKRHGDSVNVQTPKQMVIGTSAKTAEWHYKGSGDLPVRRPIDLSSKDKTRWMKIVHEKVWHLGKILGLID